MADIPWLVEQMRNITFSPPVDMHQAAFRDDHVDMAHLYWYDHYPPDTYGYKWGDLLHDDPITYAEWLDRYYCFCCEMADTHMYEAGRMIDEYANASAKRVLSAALGAAVVAKTAKTKEQLYVIAMGACAAIVEQQVDCGYCIMMELRDAIYWEDEADKAIRVLTDWRLFDPDETIQIGDELRINHLHEDWCYLVPKKFRYGPR